MNIVALIGNVTTRPEIRYTPGGKAICTFDLVVSRYGGTEADFFTVETWERQAEVCAEYVTIGRRVAIEGTLRATSRAVKVVASRVSLLGRSDPAYGGRVSSDEAEEAEVSA